MKTNFHGRSSEGGAKATIDWTDGEWHHFAGVFDNANNKLILYHNGVEVANVNENNAPGNASHPLYIGSRGGSGLF